MLKKVFEVENKNGEWYRNEIYKIVNEFLKKILLRWKWEIVGKNVIYIDKMIKILRNFLLK